VKTPSSGIVPHVMVREAMPLGTCFYYVNDHDVFGSLMGVYIA